MLESKGSIWPKAVAFVAYVIAEMLFVALLAWFFFRSLVVLTRH